MNFAQFQAILRARWLIPVACLTLFITCAVLLGLIQPKRYTAIAAVLLDSRSPDPINGSFSNTTSNYISTQIEVIRSDRVGLKVVRKLKLDGIPALKAGWLAATGGRGQIDTWLVESLGASLDVKPGKDSNVISVSYSNTNPDFAATLANAYVDAYIDTSLELRVEPARQFGAMFLTQLKETRDKVNEAQRRLSAFQQEKGIVTADERLDVETSRLNELSAQLVTLQSQTADAISRMRLASNNSPDTMASVVINALKSDLSRQQARLKEFEDRYGDSHPAVRELKANIDELKAKIAQEAGAVNTSSAVYSQISLQREAQVQRALDAQRAKVLNLKAVRDQAMLLSKDADSAQREYDSIQAKLGQVSLEGQSNQTNVSVIRSATPPLNPSSPRLKLYLVQAILLGLVVGMTLMMIVEFQNRVVRSGEDIPELLGSDYLGCIPLAQRKEGRTAPISFSPRLPVTAMVRLPAASK
jgi:succinoglycan biosynthesis transport protein ExoP